MRRMFPLSCRQTVLAATVSILTLTASITLAQTVDDARRLLSSGDVARARSAAQAAVDAHPDDPDALNMLAQLTSDGAKSQELYRRALNAAPSGPSAAVALLGIAEYYYAGGFYSNAHRMANQVVDTFPTHPVADEARLLIGRSQAASDMPYEALHTLEPLLGASQPEVRQAATIVWAETSLKLGRYASVAEILSNPGWRGDPYVMGLLTKAYGALNRERDEQNANWRRIVARREWESANLGVSSRSVPVNRTPTPQKPEQEGKLYEQFFEEDSPNSTPQQPAQSSVGSADGIYSLQVGAFGNVTNAERLAQKVRDAGYIVNLLQTGSLHRVLVGSYKTRDEARAAVPGVREASGQEAVIVRNR